MSSQISISRYHIGDIVWALGTKHPYWPSIVCPNSDKTQDVNNMPEQSIHVNRCASRRDGFWVRIENVFAFEDFDSFVQRKQSMESKMSADDFHKAFDTENDEEWRRAVIEATLLMNKDLLSRWDIFNSLRLSEEINSELSNVASRITFEKVDIKQEKLDQPARDLTGQLDPSRKEHRRSDIVPTSEAVSTEEQQTVDRTRTRTRKSLPLTKPVDRPDRTRRSLPPTQLPKKKDTDFEKFENDLTDYAIKSHPDNKLFRSIRHGNVCKFCCSLVAGNSRDLTKCSACGDHFHNKCSKNNEKLDTKPLCDECSSSMCFVCKESSPSQLKRCDVRSCIRYFHIKCLDNWKQTNFVNSTLRCPLHFCETCCSTKMDQPTTYFTSCIKCPTAYHVHSCCIPAGTIILKENRHICIRHRIESRQTLESLDWCYRCGKEGGSGLLDCNSCPKTCHMSCLDSSELQDPFLCDSCVNGQNPLYGDMVLAKYGSHHWWPAVILPPFKVPKYMYQIPPSDHQFCIRFFGDYLFGWIGRTSVYQYSKSAAAKHKVGDIMQDIAFSQAEKWFDKTQRDRGDNDLPPINSDVTRSTPQPPKYTKISSIVVVAPAKLNNTGFEPDWCSCSPDDHDPCGPSSTCENRRMSVECDACPSGPACRNRFLQLKIFPRVKVFFIDEKKGFGLKADELIRAGTLVVEYAGELITETEYQRRLAYKRRLGGPQNYYFMMYPKGLYIDGERKGSEARFANHSCNPNCGIQKLTVKGVDRITFFAKKDIEKGIEITVNYGFERGEVKQPCYCGESKCKGII